MKPPVAYVLASGEGTNFEALVSADREGRLGARIVRLIVDRPCAAEVRAERLGITTRLASLDALGEAIQGADLLLLAGFRRVLPPDLVDSFRGRILNVHPSLLPAYPGLGAIRRAHADRVPATGVTVHLVEAEVDAGPILAQEPIAIASNETLVSLTARIHAVEHRLYPETVARFLASRDGAEK